MAAKETKRDPDPKFDAKNVRQTNHCHFAGKDFDLISAGLQPDIDSDESYFGAPTLWIRPQGKSPILAKRESELKNGEYKLSRKGDSDSLESCFGVQAVPLSDSVIAITFEQDARPFGVNLGAIFYDAKAGKVLEAKILDSWNDHSREALFGRTRASNMGIPAADPALFFQTRQPRSEVNSAETMFKGKKIKVHDEDLGLVAKVTWDGKKSVSETDPNATFELSPWESYFSDKEDFKKEAGWNAEKKTFQYDMIWVLGKRNDNGNPECVQFAKKADSLSPNAWKCKEH